MSRAVLAVLVVAGLLAAAYLVAINAFNYKAVHGIRDGAIFVGFVAFTLWFVAFRKSKPRG